MASKVATTVANNSKRWIIWPSICCASIGVLAWSNASNYNKYQLSLQEFQTQILNLRQCIDAQNQSIKQQQTLISSLSSNGTNLHEMEPLKPSKPSSSSSSSMITSHSYSDIIKSVSPSIVNLVIEAEATINYGFFQIQQPTKQLGTGVIIRSDGIIVTNNHVITTRDFKEDQIITVYLSNSRKVNAHIILKDELNDLALLKIDCDDEKFPFIEISDVSTVEVGDRVLAVGNNLGLHNTVTDGIISAIGRAQASQIQSDGDDGDTYSPHNKPGGPMLNDITNIKLSKNPYLPFLQTNAAINQGSSGGALIDIDKKQLIGINTAIASPIGVNIGIGFAIPSSYVLSILRSLESPYINYNQVIRPWDGLDIMKQVIDIKCLSTDIVNKLNKLMDTTHLFYIDGVSIVDLHKQSPAKYAGIRNGDILIMLNNKIEINSPDKYWMILNGFMPNQTVNYLILRYDDKRLEYDLLDFDVTIMTPPIPSHNDIQISDSRNVLNGCLFGELQPSLGIELGINPCKEGVMLMEMPYSSFAAHFGFKAGDLLLEIDGQKIENVQQLKDLNMSRNHRHNIVIQRGDMVGEINI